MDGSRLSFQSLWLRHPVLTGLISASSDLQIGDYPAADNISSDSLKNAPEARTVRRRHNVAEQCGHLTAEGNWESKATR